MRKFAAVTMLAVLTAAPTFAQPEAPKPGPEIEMLKARVGTWTTLMKADGGEFKGEVTYKMDLGGLWLVGDMDSDLGGQKFHGRSLDTYDAASKKYVSVWVDSMSTKPMHMEGTYDAKTKTMTTVTTIDAPGPDGKPAKWKSVTVMTDADTIEMKMSVGDAKEPMFSVTYTRKK